MRTELVIDSLSARVRLDGVTVAELTRPPSCTNTARWETLAATWGALMQGAIATMETT